MSAWLRSKVGPVEPMPAKLCPKKVWKHFYSEVEHWERLGEHDVPAMRAAAEAAIQHSRQGDSELPLNVERWSRGLDLLVRHHDAAYAPTYGAEIASPETIWTLGMDAQHRQRALTPRSVFVVVQLDEPSWVVTAYRPHPLTQGVEWDEVGLQRYGVGYFRKETDMDLKSLVRAAAENLKQVSSTAPRSVQDAWWLASAVGYGRLLAEHEEIHEALPTAEKRLREADPALLEQLRGALDWEGCVKRLANALKETRSEDAEEALAASEELLAVAGAIGANEQAAAFWADAEALIAWMPAEWIHLVDHAAARCECFGASEHFVQRLWVAVESAAIGAAMNETAPVSPVAARWTDTLISADPAWRRWLSRVAALARHTSNVAETWVQAALDSIHIGEPAPIMGATTSALDPWEVRGKLPPNPPCFRVFIVDAEHPDGVEVTDGFREADGDLWRMNRQDEGAIVVLFAAQAPIPGVGLEAVLALCADRNDVFVNAREINPPK